jgi:alkanesulfonate monooxygenase SsuD/methylene tetrahydromethanopterin reductase-like flavin-dependent oxidoreductase (luciferase family)
MLEAYTTLGFLAGHTTHARLGTMVTGVTYRHPGILAKQVTTLDVVSGGRAYLGIGAAWFEREHKAMGVPFPPLKERFQRLEEALRICLQMWSDDDGPFEGRHYQLAETLNVPQALSKPHPPSDQWQRRERTLARREVRRRVQHVRRPPTVAQAIDLARALRERGRDSDAIEKTVYYTMIWAKVKTSDQIVQELGRTPKPACRRWAR